MTFARLLDLAHPHRTALALMVLLTLLEAAAVLLVPALGGWMAGEVLTATGSFLGPVACLLLVLTLLALLRTTSGIISGRTSARVLAHLRTKVHDHLQCLPLSFHQRHSQGDLLALSTYEISRLGDFLAVTLAALPAQLLTAIGAVVLMSRIDAALAVAVPILVPVFYLGLKMLGRHLRRIAQEHQKAEAAIVAAASEDLAMLSAIKSFTRESETARRFAERVTVSRNLLIKETDIYAILGPVTSLLAGIGAVALLASGGGSLQSGEISPSAMVSFFLYAALLTRPVAELSHVYGQVQSAKGTLSRLGAILDTATESDPATPHPLGRMRGQITFENVTFCYPGRDPVLRGLSLSLRPGETLALTGPNGAGKSTLVSLLLRLEVPECGTIRLDGVDIRTVALQDLRRQIAWVPQRPLLFDGSIRENIAFGRAGATDTEIERAARLAQAHDFIGDLPHGYDTEIGEHGVRLSGGQGQRIVLARAILKDPAILILDEATSMYDLNGETAFVAAAAAAFRDRTVILITHRPATLALADRIVVLERGQVVAPRTAA
ncbi:ABC transporter ATP-binding protein [Rubellimicrobium roseum]|uniref:ABC transporter ATP-binding protein n=1 Tax=Rubellimicrobium roseum TaxID=687525 RepID=A0A5C4NGA2_9RHOB|nr:ABC transporter ATP-binding protein [Rubellimicrobium roseum]TNC71489.1 ABC transporter ATP-binding protein [Rubellimicrobium roseum]